MNIGTKRILAAMVAALILALAWGTSAQATLTASNKQWVNMGNKKALIMDLAFDSSYASGGEGLNATLHGLGHVDQVIIEPSNGYSFIYDASTDKIKAMANAPAVVYEEAVNATQSGSTYSATLKYPAAFIMNAANLTDSLLPIVTSGTTVPSGHYNVDFVANVPTTLYFNSAQNNTTVYVTYITQAWSEVYDNLVENESVTVNGNAGSLAFNASAVMACKIDNTTGGVQFNSTLFLDKDDSAATGEACWNWRPGNGNTNATFSGADAIATASVTYIKRPTRGFLKENMVIEETSTRLADANNTIDYYPLIWSYANQVPINGYTTQKFLASMGTNGSNESIPFWRGFGFVGDAFRFTDGTGAAATSCTYIKGLPSEVRTIPLEVPNGFDLSGLTGVKVMVIGH